MGKSVRIYWVFSMICSVCAIAVIVFLWFSVDRPHPHGTRVIHNPENLEKFIRQHSDSEEFSNGAKPIQVPTGFFIQSLAFVSACDVNVTGYIWQKYPVDFPPEITKGIVFPEEVSSADTQINLTYEAQGTQDGVEYELQGWYFDVTLRQSFDYSDYPLDLLAVWLRVWPKDMKNERRVMLIPDFNAYANVGEGTFGLDTEIVHGEWEIDSTFFSIRDIPYDTDFGMFSDAKEHTHKELYINIGIRRSFINAFIINLVPLFVVALLLFAQLLTVSNDKKLMERFGFNVSGAIATCSALFFVVLLAHVQVRSQFASSGLLYIEYFYLIMYFVILVCASNAYLFSLDQNGLTRLIHYRDNLIPKVAYWPIVLWTMAFATIAFL